MGIDAHGFSGNGGSAVNYGGCRSSFVEHEINIPGNISFNIKFVIAQPQIDHSGKSRTIIATGQTDGIVAVTGCNIIQTN